MKYTSTQKKTPKGMKHVSSEYCVVGPEKSLRNMCYISLSMHTPQ